MLLTTARGRGSVASVGIAASVDIVSIAGTVDTVDTVHLGDIVTVINRGPFGKRNAQAESPDRGFHGFIKLRIESNTGNRRCREQL